MADIDEIQEEATRRSLDEVQDDAASDDAVPPVRYEVASFGIDYDVEGIVRRLTRGDMLIPSFQRTYIWKLPEASRFIESLLLGLPIPGVFLGEEQGTNRLLVIDGQQRLKTLQFYYEGVFNPRSDDKTRRVFTLTKVQERFIGRTYDTLDRKDQLALDNSVIHATIVKQLTPSDDDTSIYHIFERLNSAGRLLTPQEMRCALYHGALINELKEINGHSSWRNIFGRPNQRLKDQELILRFIALYDSFEGYQSPMTEFLNKFMQKHREESESLLHQWRSIFHTTSDVTWKALGRKAFRPERALNAAVFDSVMVGLAHRLQRGDPVNPSAIEEAYDKLLSDVEYATSVTHSTGNEGPVKLRVQKALSLFGKL